MVSEVEYEEARTTSSAPLLPAPARDPFATPLSLFKVSAPPSTLVGSAGSGWDGAFFAEATSAPAGEVFQDHEVVVIQRWLTALRTRPTSRPGDWVTHAPGVRVRLPGDSEYGEWRGTLRLQLLFVTPERVEAVLGRPWDRTGLARWPDPRLELPFVGDVLSAMRQDVDAGHPAGPLTGDALLVALLSYLDSRGVTRPSPPPGAMGRRMERVREFIEANLARPLRLSELAGQAGLGVRRFGAVFAAETGWSPHRYVLNRRIEQAKVLMRDPELTLGQIALAVGFADQAHFSRVFGRYAGEAPRAYRRR